MISITLDRRCARIGLSVLALSLAVCLSPGNARGLCCETRAGTCRDGLLAPLLSCLQSPGTLTVGEMCRANRCVPIAPTPVPTATRTATSTRTRTPTRPPNTATATRTATKPTPTRTARSTATAMSTRVPSATNTAVPTSTSTRVPTATNSPLPTSTATLAPSATNTAVPTSTSTPVPTATDTPLPTSTETLAPTTTDTPLPTSTSTVAPSATNTPVPTATAIDTATPSSTATPTATYTPTATPICGDGVVAGGEQCDLGQLNGQPTTCCTAGCTAVAVGTPCDDGEECTENDACAPAGVCSGAAVAPGPPIITAIFNDEVPANLDSITPIIIEGSVDNVLYAFVFDPAGCFNPSAPETNFHWQINTPAVTGYTARGIRGYRDDVLEVDADSIPNFAPNSITFVFTATSGVPPYLSTTASFRAVYRNSALTIGHSTICQVMQETGHGCDIEAALAVLPGTPT